MLSDVPQAVSLMDFKTYCAVEALINVVSPAHIEHTDTFPSLFCTSIE